MNLTRALDVALPELPPERFRESYPRFHPDTFHKIHHEPTGDTVMVLAPGTRRVMFFTPQIWELIKMFDGRRSYEWLSRWCRGRGMAATPDDLRKFAENLDAVGLWYKTPAEESAALMEDLREGRKKRKFRFGDISKMEVFTFDADKYLTRLYRVLKWIYDPRFVALSFAALAWMFAVWILRSREVLADSVAFWNMSEKGFRDVIDFYLMFLVVGFFHESGHAVTAKHFGAEVHRVGLILVYTMPGFFVDSGEVWVHHTRRERCLTILAGFWYELMTCAVATLIWWGTPRGGTAHDLAYKYILIGGIMPVILNMNPLMRLDGYLCLTEWFRLPNLKQRSTAFLSAWVRKHVFAMDATVPVLPRRRALLFAAYALISGAYSYLVMLFLARLTYRICLRISPVWAFLPATLVALRIFKSRIVTFMQFLRNLYLDKKELLARHRRVLIPAGAVVLVLLVVPIRHEQIQAPFLLEPAQQAVVRNQVGGMVEFISAEEGRHVRAGEVLARLRNLDVETQAAEAASQLRLADAAATQAELRYANYASARQEQEKWAKRAALARDQQRRLVLTTPIPGVITTPRADDALRTWLPEGSTVAEIQDLSAMRARVYVPEAELDTVAEATGSRLFISALGRSMQGRLVSVAPVPRAPDPTLIALTKYKGMNPPPQYVANVLLDNRDGALRSGMTGEARIFGQRRSIVGSLFRPAIEFLARKFW
jgi:putative peptide zinc metalloprotease protein